MKHSGAALFPLALMILLAGMTFWLERTVNAPGPRGPDPLKHDPDFFIEHFNVRRFDPQGALEQSLVARKMTHYADDDSAEVEQPDMTIHRKPRPTRIISDHAWLSKDGKEIRLDGHVRLTRKGLPGQPDTVIQTEAMTAWPDDEFAKGSVPVTITQGGSVVHGTSIDYNGKLSLTHLGGRANGVFPRK